MSTIDQIARLEMTVRTSIVDRKVCIAVFSDLSNAIDKVWHHALLNKLAMTGISGQLLRWLQGYLKDRTFRVYFDKEFSASRHISSGVSQGSILSPVLFNRMMPDLPFRAWSDYFRICV